MEKNCLVCGVILCKRVNERESQWQSRKYCSLNCSLKVTSVHKQKNHYSIPIGNIPWNKNKKGIHLSPNSEFKSGMQINLGRVRLDMRGENNFNWKGGITKLANAIRKWVQYKEWRDFIFQRDNWTCQMCKKRGNGRLEVHHNKISFAKLLKKYNIQTIDDAHKCPELFDKNNGITLCKDCHRKTDDYGRKNYRKLIEGELTSC
jgi:hypothetical protein